MKFLALLYAEETNWAEASEADMAAVMEAHNTFGEAAGKAGVLVGGEALELSNTATMVQVRDGERMLARAKPRSLLA